MQDKIKSFVSGNFRIVLHSKNVFLFEILNIQESRFTLKCALGKHFGENSNWLEISK